jgi:hypothetical protein
MRIIKIKLATLAKDTGWWEQQTKEFQEQYLKDHPKSKRKVTNNKIMTKKQSPVVTKKVIKPYKPNVFKSTKIKGITDAARVGIPGHKVIPPPGVPRLPNLTKVERKVEAKFARDFEKNPEVVAKDFLQMVLDSKKPPTFGTDDAKMLTKEWTGPAGEERSKRRATLNTVLHQTANAVAKRAFLQYLDTLKEGDKILVTVGGCGAGKGYSLGNVDVARQKASECAAVWDSAGDQNATENPWIQKEAEQRGLKVVYVYVHADPKVSWADPNRGVIKRANNPEDGRMVDSDVFADSYAIGAKNHYNFAKLNRKNPNAEFLYIDSENKAPTLVKEMPKSALSIDRHELASFAKKAVKEADAPEYIKKGALIGTRIWGDKEHAAMRKTVISATSDLSEGKVKYSWKQYIKDEDKRLKKLSEHPNAGKYGGGGSSSLSLKEKLKDMKKKNIKPSQIPDKELRLKYEKFLNTGKINLGDRHA